MAYEHFLRDDVFKRVLNDYTQRSSAFMSSAIDESPAFRVSSSLGHAGAERLAYPIVSSDTVKAAIPAPRYIPDENREGVFVLDPEQPNFILQHYLAHQADYAALQYLPDIVSFYQLLLNTFGHRITLDQAQCYSVPELFDWLQHKFFDSKKVEESIQSLHNAYDRFVDAWNSIRSILSGMDVCADAYNNRRFESDIPIVDKNSPILSVLINTSQDEAGAIGRLLESLLSIQSKMLEIRERKEYSKCNAHGLLWDLSTPVLPEVSCIVEHTEHARSFFLGYQFTKEHFDALMVTAARLDRIDENKQASGWSSTSIKPDLTCLERAVQQ